MNERSRLSKENQTVAYDYAKKGKKYFDEGHYEDAISYYKKALNYSSGEKNTEALYKQIKIANEKIKALNEKRKSNTNVINTIEKTNAQKTTTYANTATILPEKNQAYKYAEQGKKYFDDGQYGEAINYYKKALSLSPEGSAEVLRKQIMLASEKINKAEETKQEKHKKIYQYAAEGKKYFDNGRYEEAISCYEKALSLSPEKSAVKTLQGQIKSADEKIYILDQQRKPDTNVHSIIEGTSNINLKSDLNPLTNPSKQDMLHTYAAEGKKYFDNGRYEDAVNYYEKALNLSSEKNQIDLLHKQIKLADEKIHALDEERKLKDQVKKANKQKFNNFNTYESILSRAHYNVVFHPSPSNSESENPLQYPQPLDTYDEVESSSGAHHGNGTATGAF